MTYQGDAVSSRAMLYDAAGRRTRFTWFDGTYVTYDYDATGAMTAIKENSATALATFDYDDLGRRMKLTRGNGVATNYGYDGGSRLTSLGLDLAATANDQSYGYAYNPAGQITQRTASNDLYARAPYYNANRTYAANALNQYSTVGALTPAYDAKGNLASVGARSWSYNSKNQLVQTNDTGKQFYFDPTGRLDSVLSGTGAALSLFQYDGANVADEIDTASHVIQRRYVWGPGSDEPLVWYEGSGTSDRRYLAADERGSVVAVTDGSGNATALNAYDEYGIPAATNLGRFQYTGQAWIAELGMYDYKARTYAPTIGRFMQTDPIGYGDGVNWYNYVQGDPVNGIDPSGLATGTNVPYDGPLCPSCSGSSTFSIGGDSSRSEQRDRSAGATGNYTRGFQLTLTTSFGKYNLGDPVPDFSSFQSDGGFDGGFGFGLRAGLPQSGEGGLQQVGFRPRGGLAGVAREVLRQTFMRALPKVKFPTNAAGVNQAEFGRLSGLSQSDKTFRAFTQTDINAAVERLQGAGLTRGDVANAADFYSYNAFRDVGNEAAAFRSYYLQQVMRGW